VRGDHFFIIFSSLGRGSAYSDARFEGSVSLFASLNSGKTLINSMLELKSGTYLGKVEKLLSGNGIIAGITTYPESVTAEQLHYHETLHLSFVLAGGNLEKRHRQDIERLPGVVTFYDAGEPHQSTNTMALSRHLNVEIEAGFLERHGFLVNAVNLRFLKTPDAKLLMLKMFKELQADDELSAMAMESLVLALLTITKQQNSVEKRPKWIDQVYQFIHDRWDESTSLRELSLVAGVHPVTLSKFFPRYFGCSIGEFARKVKIERALALIESSNRSLTEIAGACGFADQSHFIRAFKSQTGLLPKQYRHLCRK
jgi:AraC family transcriptional regulator